MNIYPNGVVPANGDKMVKVSVYFWTDSLAGSKDKIVPKHAHAGGTVVLRNNKSHGIRSGPETNKVFNTIAEIGPAIEAVLAEAGVKLHHGTTASKLYP